MVIHDYTPKAEKVKKGGPQGLTDQTVLPNPGPSGSVTDPGPLAQERQWRMTEKDTQHQPLFSLLTCMHVPAHMQQHIHTQHNKSWLNKTSECIAASTFCVDQCFVYISSAENAISYKLTEQK